MLTMYEINKFLLKTEQIKRYHTIHLQTFYGNFYQSDTFHRMDKLSPL